MSSLHNSAQLFHMQFFFVESNNGASLATLVPSHGKITCGESDWCTIS